MSTYPAMLMLSAIGLALIVRGVAMATINLKELSISEIEAMLEEADKNRERYYSAGLLLEAANWAMKQGHLRSYLTMRKFEEEN